MLAHGRQIVKRRASVANAAFTLVEVVISVAILAMVMAGTIYGYVQINRNAEWNSMSYAAQSFALQGLEQVRAAKWDLSGNPVWDDIHGAGQLHPDRHHGHSDEGLSALRHQLHQPDGNHDSEQ